MSDRQFVPEQVINTVVENVATPHSKNSLRLASLASSLEEAALILQDISRVI
jgi:hypothetical protein